MNTLQAFQEALARRQKIKEQKDKPKFSGYTEDYEQPQWVGLQEDQETVLRFVGFPAETRRSPYHTKQIFYSQILKDDKKGFIKVIWPQLYEEVVGVDGKVFKAELGTPDSIDKSWILYRLYQKATEADFVRYTKSQYPDGKDEKGRTGTYVKKYTDSPTYQRIENNKASYSLFAVPFYPSRRFIMPVIDRSDSWCRDNKHYKLLSSKISTVPRRDGKDGEPNIYIDWGITASLYEKIMTHVAAYCGNWELIDYVLKPYKLAGKKTFEYEVKDIDEKVTEYSKQIGKNTPLTDEERAYKAYNLDEAFRYCSYSKLLKNIPDLFKQADIDFHTNFYQELEEKAALEKEEWEKNKKQEESKSVSISGNPIASPDGQQRTPPVEVEKKKKPDPFENKTIEEVCESYFPKWESLTSDDRKYMVESLIKIGEDKNPIWKPGVTLLPCDNERGCRLPTGKATELPDTVFSCPMCGKSFSTGEESG